MRKILLLAVFAIIYFHGHGQGHGPLYGLQTPTLPQGNFNFNLSAMGIASGKDHSAMLRYTGMYGVTEDIQVNLTTPTVLEAMEEPPRTRGNSNMPANGNIEASVWYRFFSNAFDVGKRFESTLILGGSVPMETGLGHSLHGAISTGYASRTWYGWIGGGYQYYFNTRSTQPGDLPYASLVAGYRPDFIEVDWRMFVESLWEFPGPSDNSEPVSLNARGEKLLIGPSFLGLYGAWGISFGGLLPVKQNVNEDNNQEKFRLSINVSYWL